MAYVHVPTDLWNTSLMPEGLLERWLVSEGATINAGEPVAYVRINDDLHVITAPATGRITAMATVNTVVDPGSAIAEVQA